VARHHQADRGVSQGFDQIEVLFAGQAEDDFHALVFERTDEKIGGFHGSLPLGAGGGVRRTSRRGSLMSSMAQRTPSRPRPEFLTPPYGM
jgi:hypothetical protein